MIPHGGDVGLRVYGAKRSELFENGAAGMVALLSEPGKFSRKKVVLFRIRSTSWESLLVDWLHEILYQFTIKKIGFHQFKIKKIRPFFLEAYGYGERIHLNRHPIFREIKAVTYHHLKIRKIKDHFFAKIIFDL